MQMRIFFMLTAAALVGATARAADDSFVGKWKMNPEKSQFSGLTYKIEDLGGDKFRFSFGDDVETMPADGKDHSTKFGNTWAITKESPTKWKFVVKRAGKVISKDDWSISDDGQTFTASSDETRPDGSTGHTDVKLKRTDSGSGFAGNWESTEIKISSPTTLEIAKWQGDGYALSNAALKERLEFKLDGKDYMDKGPRVPLGMKVSAKKVDDRTIELTYKFKGKTTETDRWELSADGKTLMNTVTYAGESKPEVDVYDRQ